MKTGVYAKKDYEIIVSKLFKTIFYNKENYFGCQIYKDDNLTCVIELDKFEGTVRYAYKKSNNKINFNDIHLTSFLEFTYFEMNDDTLKEKDAFNVTLDESIKTNLGISFNNDDDFDMHILTQSIKYDIEIKKGEVKLICSPYKNTICYQPYIRIEKDKIPICNIDLKLNNDEIYENVILNDISPLIERFIKK